MADPLILPFRGGFEADANYHQANIRTLETWAREIIGGGFIPVTKTVDESVTSSTVLQNDDHLFLPMEANGVYYVRFIMWHQSASTGHFKIAFAAPSGSDYHINSLGIDTGGSTWAHTQHRDVTNVASFFSGATGLMAVSEGIVVNGGTAGNLQLQWAQAVSNASATILKRGSCLIPARLI